MQPFYDLRETINPLCARESFFGPFIERLTFVGQRKREQRNRARFTVAFFNRHPVMKMEVMQ